MFLTMNLLVERLQMSLDHAGLAWSAAAIKIGLSAQAASNWKKGKIGRDTLKKLAHLTGVNSGWLLDGTGEMISTSNIDVEEINDLEILTYEDGDNIPDGYVAIDYYDNVFVSAGGGYLNLEQPSSRKMLFPLDLVTQCNVNVSTAKVIRVRGDSMRPIFSDGQPISIDMSARKIYDGEIYAFQVGEDTKVKYLFNWHEQGMGGFKAVSRNEDKIQYPDEHYSPNRIETEGIHILGQYWWKADTRKVRR